MGTESERILTVYLTRHLPSEQNVAGRGPVDTPLAKGFKGIRASLVELVKKVNPQLVISGTLQRHEQTTGKVLKKAGYVGEVEYDHRLNAVLDTPLVTKNPKKTEKKYDLLRFTPGEDGLYENDGGVLKFDPEELGILPFDPLYSAAYFHIGLWPIVFSDHDWPMDNWTVDRNIKMFHRDLIKRFGNSEYPVGVVCFGSCSANALNLEYALFTSIASNLYSENGSDVLRPTKYGSEDRVMFPQQHDEVMTLGYTRADQKRGRERLRAIDGNVKIDGLVSSL